MIDINLRKVCFNVGACLLSRLDLNLELPQGQTGSVGTSVASAEQVHIHIQCSSLFLRLVHSGKARTLICLHLPH